MKRNILDALNQGFVLGDGGILVEAKYRGYSTPKVVAEFPDVLRLIHQDFFRAGSQVLQAHTWFTTPKHLKEREGDRDWSDRVEEINRTAVRVAQQVAGDEALVAGSICATAYGEDALDLSDNSACDAAQAEWDQQISWIVDEGVDFLICEAFLRLGEARLALECCKKTGLPTVVTIGVKPEDRSNNRTRDGASPAECARALVDEGADIVGVNCGKEPAQMWPMALEMREAVDVPIAFQPVGYRTDAVRNFRPIRESVVVPGVEMAMYALRARDHGINYLGACCGAGPELIRAMAQALGCERDPI